MKDYRLLLWSTFLNTGDINDYLKYTLLSNLATDLEMGEEFGADKDHGDSNKDDQVR